MELEVPKAGWYNAFRPWTLHGAVVPVVLGGIVAFKDGQFDWLIFALVIIGGILLQSAANLLNTYGDFRKGYDTVENEVMSPELVTGKLRAEHVLMAGLACLALTALIGVVFIFHIGWGILLFGLAGIGGAGLYTVGASYKYHGLGLVSVFLLMGILMPMGTYYVLTGALSSEVLLLSLPNALLITAVLSGNETRDYYEDKMRGVGTLSSRMSYRSSMRLYLVLNTVPYVLSGLSIAVGLMPWPCILSFLTLPQLRSLVENSRHAHDDKVASIRLVPMAFKLNWMFGSLLAVGYVLSLFI